MGKYKRWTDEETQILINNNGKDLDYLCEVLPNHIRTQIIAKCKRDNIKYGRRYNYWTDEEEDLLKQNNNSTLEFLSNIFPNKMEDSIYQKAKRLNVDIYYPDNLWTSNEDEILKENAFGVSSFEKLSKLIPERSEDAIRRRFFKLGLQITNPNTIPKTKTDKFTTKTSRISRYKEYGIILDYDKLIETYNDIQWWKWCKYKTPNGKKLITLPKEIYEDKDRLINLVKYVIEEEIGFKNREDVLKINIDLLNKYKVNFKHQLPNSVLELLNLIFPKYKIRGFELKNAPIHYWEDKNNCDEYLEYVLQNELNIEEIVSFKTLIPNIFTYSNIRNLGYADLLNAIFRYHFYDSFYTWINYLHPEWNLTPEDFLECRAFDDTKLDSREEVLIYNLLKENLKLNIKSTGQKGKYKFNNAKHSENYIPDFIATNSKGNKIIVEYFGLYRENYGKSKILKNYYYKTLRKVEFFNNLEGYTFLPIYQYEILDFEKLKQKLKSFFHV